MKILKLHVEKFRGIVDLELDFNGKNAVVFGPNGVGKSAVVDAIDFLLLGDISRLKGEGTGDVSVAEHAAHIGHEPAEAKVTAIIQSINGKIFTVRRTVAQKDRVAMDQDCAAEFEEMVTYAKSTAHCLTRRELLRFILTAPTKRADQIQSILDIKDLKENHDIFYKLKRVTERTIKEETASLKRHTTELQSAIGANKDSQLLENVNALRETLGGAALCSMADADFTSELLFSDTKETGEITGVIRLIDGLIEYLPTLIPELTAKQRDVSFVVEQIKKKDAALESADSVALIKAGLKLLDGSGRCPLCLHEWVNEDDLRKVLRERKEKSEVLSTLLEDFKTAITALADVFTGYKRKIASLPTQLKKWDTGCVALLDSEVQVLAAFSEVEKCPFFGYLDLEAQIITYSSQRETETLIESLKTQTAKLIPLVDAQSRHKSNAWQSLNTAKEIHAKITALKAKLPAVQRAGEKAAYMLDTYDTVQSEILNEMFASISERFTEFYKSMHGDDEGQFSAKLENEGTAVNMSVDFHGQGRFPPMAFHSEGHQDSMGIALFFALMEKLTVSEFGLVVLDDVVMSVDIEHRKNFCKILTTFFPDRQFIITTHDTVWAKNLVNERVVESRNSIEFLCWSVEEGPIIVVGHDVWRICREKAHMDLSGASAFFRREMECYFENICHKLHARLPYNSTHKWDYGQYKDGAYSELKNKIKKARKRATEFKKEKTIARLEQLDENLTNCLNAVNTENWVTNVLVHNNPKFVIAHTEFLAAVDAMEKFCHCFQCPDCHSTLTVANIGLTPTMLCCKCGTFAYPL